MKPYFKTKLLLTLLPISFLFASLNGCQSFYNIEHCLKGDTIRCSSPNEENIEMDCCTVFLSHFNGFDPQYNITKRIISDHVINKHYEQIIIEINKNDTLFCKDTIEAYDFNHMVQKTNDYKYIFLTQGYHCRFSENAEISYGSGIVLFSDAEPYRYLVLEYDEKEIVYLAQNDDYFDIITVELEYTEPLISRMINSFASRINRGDYLSKEVYHKYRIDKNLKQIYERMILPEEAEVLIQECK
ncbi:MAG: hypothetical protein KAH48_11640 [Chlorobi bacterium]|nr:hypothetical protein [Chlorobiota bacterium]